MWGGGGGVVQVFLCVVLSDLARVSPAEQLQFGGYPHGRSPTMSTMTSDSGSQATSNSMPESERKYLQMEWCAVFSC